MLLARSGAVAGGFTAAVYVYAPQKWAAARRQVQNLTSLNPVAEVQFFAGSQWARAATFVSETGGDAQSFIEGQTAALAEKISKQKLALLASANAALPPSRTEYVSTILPTGTLPVECLPRYMARVTRHAWHGR